MRSRSYFHPDLFSRIPSPALAATDAGLAAGASGLMLDPRHAPRDEAIFWLTAAAEIEHFLMVQYLFSAYSLNPAGAGAQQTNVTNLQNSILQIAREEMGHLITVQNLLHILGAPLHFGREHSPYASDIYPFRFKLEPMSLPSLAKYVMAESPIDRDILMHGLSTEDLALYDGDITSQALASNDGREVRHVGPIFKRLRQLFATGLADSDLRLDRGPFQARWDDWGYKPRQGTDDLKVLVYRFDQATAAGLRSAAIDAIQEIGDQGEEADTTMGDGESHFERFFLAYTTLRDIEAALGRTPTWPVVENPNVSIAPPPSAPDQSMLDAMLDSPLAKGRIDNARSRRWAQLCNFRYRLLLQYLQHSLLLEGRAFRDDGDRTPKGVVMYWTFNEMRRVKKLAQKLVQMPLDEGTSGRHAGPPFELPYSLNLPIDDRDRWAGHADVLDASILLATEMQADPEDSDDPFLVHLLIEDTSAAAIARSLAAGSDIDPEYFRTDFRKTVRILDEAVRGFAIHCEHAAFWRDVGIGDFDKAPGINPVFIPTNPDGSLLVKMIELPEENGGRMPRFRPRIDPTRLAYIREWIARGAPDNDPPGQIGIAGEPKPKDEPQDQAPPTDPDPSAPGFAADVKPLFRELDRSSMLFLFDLHDYDAVKTNAGAILASLEAGRMPCTGSWPVADVETFRAWVKAGFPA
ncbi:MAG: ferritin-like domain-containing protein [Alphaproteobacteria bacterium]